MQRKPGEPVGLGFAMQGLELRELERLDDESRVIAELALRHNVVAIYGKHNIVALCRVSVGFVICSWFRYFSSIRVWRTCEEALCIEQIPDRRMHMSPGSFMLGICAK